MHRKAVYAHTALRWACIIPDGISIPLVAYLGLSDRFGVRSHALIHPSSWKGYSPKLGSLLLRVFGLFLFHYPQALDHLEGEAHYAALLALVLDVDGLVVVVDEYLGEDRLVVVEPFCPLGDIFVLHLSGLLAHARVLLPSR